MDASPVITRGHNAAVFVPPVTEAALPYLDLITDRRTLVVTADADRAVALAAPGRAGPARFAVSGLARAARRLAADPPAVVCLGAADGLALLKRSALKPLEFRTIVIAWPEQLDEAGAAALEALLSESDREAQRLILTAQPGAVLDRLIERYAFRAMTFGFPPTGPSGAASPGPVGAARYVLAGPAQLDDVRRRVLDALAPEHDDAVVIEPCPSSREAAASAVARAGGEPPVIVAEPHQLAWLKSLFSPLSALPLPAALDALEQRAEAIRARVARTIEKENLERELFLLGPLLSRYDASEVAAAALRLADVSAQTARPAAPSSGSDDAGPRAPGVPSWAKIWVGVGRKDHVKPGDLVGAIANEAKVPGEAIGKIEVRDLFCIVEVKAEHAERVVASLTGATLRGRRLTARVDRGASARPPRRA